MTDAVERFLHGAGWSAATRVPLAGDASARRYQRLTGPGGQSAILMLDPKGQAGTCARFLEVAAYLRALDLSAPAIIAADTAAGLILMEDFGDALLSRALEDDPTAGLSQYRAAEAVLARLATAPPMAGLTVLTPETLAGMVEITFDMLGPASAAAAFRAPLLRDLARACAAHLDGPQVTIHRDYHADNLIWLPARTGPARIGLLDFQDAVIGPVGYDLVSLVHDARRDVPAAIRADLIARHAATLGIGAEDFVRRVALLSLQRNLRIIGVFLRLARQGGKPGYLRLIPRVAGYCATAVNHPDLAELKDAVSAVLDSVAAVPMEAGP